MTTLCRVYSDDMLPSLTSCASIADCDKSHDDSVPGVFTRCDALFDQLRVQPDQQHGAGAGHQGRVQHLPHS